jgi:hypothetical protein
VRERERERESMERETLRQGVCVYASAVCRPLELACMCVRQLVRSLD